MSRAPVSVVVVASGTADIFRDCLESLRVSRDQHDEVACIVPGDRADLLAVAEAEKWLRIVAGDSWAAGIDATAHPIVVLLDGDVLLAPHWLDPVVEAFGDAGVVAAGPRCDRSFGPQEAQLPAHALRTRDAFKEFARHWRHQHRGQVSAVERLGSVCVAVRRDALAAAGGPDAEPPYAGLAARGRIVVAHESLVAHLRSPRCTVHALTGRHGPFLSAVVLTRDDEATIEGCLDSVRPFADEILVYDLGSSDRTRELAAGRGATVVEGRFDGDFGAARSRALGAATGEWALCVDPDETAAGNPMAVRGKLLFTNTEAILLPVRSEEQAAGGGALSVPAFALRLFKRQRVRYTGRRHELAVDRVSGEPVTTTAALDLLELVHPGGDAAGNLRTVGRSIAEVEAVAATQLDRAHAAIAAGNYPIAARLCREIIDGEARGGVYEVALKTLMNALVPMGQLDEANRVLGELRLRSATAFGPDEWEARIRFAEGDLPAALDAVGRLPERPLPGGPPAAYRDQLAEIEIKSLFLLDRPAEAAARLRDCLRAGILPLSIAEMAEALSADASALAEVVELVPAERRRLLYHIIRSAPADLADEMLEALWLRPGEGEGVLGAVAQIGGLLPLHRAHTWSVRLRDAGLNRHCALLRIAEHPDRTGRDRALAAAVAMERFGAVEAMPLLSEALGALPDDEEARVLDELREIAPGVVALTTTTHGGGS